MVEGFHPPLPVNEKYFVIRDSASWEDYVFTRWPGTLNDAGPKGFLNYSLAKYFLAGYCLNDDGSIIDPLYASFSHDPAPYQTSLDDKLEDLTLKILHHQIYIYSIDKRPPVPEHIKGLMPLAGTSSAAEVTIPSRPKNHLEPEAEILEDLDLYCALPDGSPAVDLPYKVSMADGAVLTGTLDQNGEKHLAGLKPNSVNVEFGEQPDEAAIAATRSQIDSVLKGIIADEQAEADSLALTYKELNSLEKGLVNIGALLTGLGKAGADLVESTYNLAAYGAPLRRLKQTARAGWDAFNADESDNWITVFTNSWADSEHQALVKALGFDPAAISKEKVAEAYEIASFICSDSETKDLLTDFVADYASVQHHTEFTEMGGAAIFDIVLGALLVALTGGAGNAAMAAKKTSKLGKLAAPLKKLTKLLKKKNRFKKKSGHTGGKVKQKIGKPDGAKVPNGNNHRSKNTPHNQSNLLLETNPQDIRKASSKWSKAKKERFNKADKFYMESGYKDYDSHLRGIDFEKPVETVKYPKGKKLYQYSYLDRITGKPKVGSYYYSDKKIDITKLGFDLDSRKMIEVELEEPAKLLKSHAANIEDWDGSGKVFAGGEIQLFSPNLKPSNVKVLK